MPLYALTIHEAAAGLAHRHFSAVELSRSVLERIEQVDDRVRAYITVLADRAIMQAEEADRRLARDEHEPLTGIPIALKDILCLAGERTTAASRMLEHYIPPYSATVVERMAAAGAIFIGKTNLDEFAMGSSTEHSAFFPTHNPWNLETVPGGSSGGSAAAVAADLALGSLGSDTGGSIRQPAALCGVVGLKPTYGRVSRYGLMAFASSLDQIGPFAKDVTDCALLLQTIAGHDPRDATSARTPVPDYRAALRADLRGMRLGIPQEYFVQGLQPGMEAIVRSAIAALEAQGATLCEVSLPSSSIALPTYYIIAPAEASANLARYDGIKYGYSAGAPTMWENYDRTRGQGFGAEVKRRIMLGTYALSEGYADAYYWQAQKVRTVIKGEFDEVFRTCDALVAPVTPTVAFKLGQRLDDPYQMYLCDVCTLPANIAGIPGISVPCGMLGGLPVGLQVLAPAFGEETALRVAYAYEQSGHFQPGRPRL
ncbi:MAG TPA: Asp-tRNA(Asn)/Glu-tRNA(Gln) amidotransferase subunit GatA [Chloroflexota bacterium]|nr:Asp-tRNA(Asn)/Glu-tRNA(Gln) amidotransferase subunit GatA [Chloroflexota bacterium]